MTRNCFLQIFFSNRPIPSQAKNSYKSFRIFVALPINVDSIAYDII
jgi:hypothetical protein